MRQSYDPDALTQALAEPSRRAILEILRYGRKTVTELVQLTNRKQPNISNHLAKMRRQGLVRAERMGRQVYYSLSSPFAEALMRLYEVAQDPLQGQGDAEGEPDPASAEPTNGRTPALPAADPAAHLALDDLQAAYLEAVLNGEEDRALALVNGLLARQTEMETIYLRIFQATLNQIGHLYQKGETDPAREHLASEITERLMTKVAQFYVPLNRNGYRAVLGCVAGNQHSLGLRMLSDGLKSDGWETRFLGANVPTASFINLVAEALPDLVVISCAIEEQWAGMCDLLHRLDTLRQHSEAHAFQVGVGGYFLAKNAHVLQGHPIDFLTENLHDFMAEVRQRFPLPRPVPE